MRVATLASVPAMIMASLALLLLSAGSAQAVTCSPDYVPLVVNGLEYCLPPGGGNADGGGTGNAHSTIWTTLAPILAISTGVWACMAALGDFLEFKDKNLKEWRNLLKGFKEMPFKEQNAEAPLRTGQWVQVASKFLPGVGALILAWIAYHEMGDPNATLVSLLLASLLLIPWIARRGVKDREKAVEYEEMMLHHQETMKDQPAMRNDPPPGHDADIQV